MHSEHADWKLLIKRYGTIWIEVQTNVESCLYCEKLCYAHIDQLDLLKSCPGLLVIADIIL